MIEISRRHVPLLVGLTTTTLLVGVMALVRSSDAGEALAITAPQAISAAITLDPVPTTVPPGPAPTTAAPRAAAPSTAAPMTASRAPAVRTTTPARPAVVVASPAPLPRAAKVQARSPGGSQTAQVLALTNQARARAGCPALRVDARLTAAAQGHSADMAAHDYFAHASQDGSRFTARIVAQGYPSPGGENIAVGQQDAQAVMTAWLNSPDHRANIDNCTFTTIGLGLAGTDKYWTQDFGR